MRQQIWQYCLPQRLLTQSLGALAASTRWPRLRHWFIKHYVKFYGVDLQEAVEPDLTTYISFNDFFTRALKPSVRPLAEKGLLCPVDGCVSESGDIAIDQVYQAKGHTYSLTALLAGDEQLVQQFQHGKFITLYLSPKDYHRIHMPLAGELQRMIYVPGRLFSVNPQSVAGIPGLFARNERLICAFNTALGPMVLILVGAMIVGSMSTVWAGQVTPPRVGAVTRWDYQSDVKLARGAEMGQFQLGSTVIALFPKNTVDFAATMTAGASVRWGQLLGEIIKCNK